MIDRQYIPLFVFVACLALGLALAVFTDQWPTALAIALSGCALGLAMRQPEVEDHDAAFLREDLAEIRAAGEAHGEDIATLKTSLDEVAGIVESLATDMQRVSGGTNAAEAEKMRALVDAMGKRVAALDAPMKQSETRLDVLEQSVAALRTERTRGEDVAELRPVEFAATGTGASSGGGALPVSFGGATGAAAPAAGTSLTERAGRLRQKFSRTKKGRQVRAEPLFDRSHKPSSLMVDDPSDPPSVEGDVAVVRHALSLVGGSDTPGSRIFARLSADTVVTDALADALEPVLEEAGEAASRLVVVLPQAAIQGGPPKALAMLLKAGARFGLESMIDWSADLDALAGRGLAVIAVDGPAMAKSAIAQKGDPTRLRQVLHARGIDLMAGAVETRMQLDAVQSLVPDLLAGPGLGEATLMDVSA